MGNDTGLDPDKAGPKGALDMPAGRKGRDKPRSGPPGNEGNNTRRDFVQLPKKKPGRDER